MVHERYEKKCGKWSHLWTETKREVLNRHAKVCDQKVKVYFSCKKCDSAKTETLKAPGHNIRPINDVVMKDNGGYLQKVRILACTNCDFKDAKKIGKKWKS